jgi:hypothetical protein
VRRPCAERLFEAKLRPLPEAIRSNAREALRTAAGARTVIQKYLAEKLGPALAVKPEDVTVSMTAEEKTAAQELNAQIAETEVLRRKWGKIQALYDVGPPPPTHLLVRGSEDSPGYEVPPGFLQVLSCSASDALATSSPPYDGTSGRRSAFARWLTRADSPASALVARVMVNRIWKHLFGKGIVPTPDNFGVQGERPTHPDLLEWLSAEFVENGWRVKPVVKLILTSTAYRQASRRDASQEPAALSAEKVDPANDLLWRMRLRRLEAEVVRDSILSVSGDLDRALGGPPVLISARPDGMVTVAPDRQTTPAAQYRRSVYLLSRRAYNLSLLSVFDRPLVATNCLSRGSSALPLQSLFMINDALLAEQAEHFAGRVEATHGRAVSAEDKVKGAFRMALARSPGASEVATCAELLRRQTERSLAAGKPPLEAARQAARQLCLTLLNTSEFLFAE